MKKFLFLLIAIAFTMGVNAQSTSPRYGTLKNQDNTARVLTYNYTSITDAAGADSVSLKPNAWLTNYRVALTDSVYISGPVVTASYAGDNVKMIVSGASGTKIKFASTNFIMSSTAPYATTTLILSSGGRALIQFTFDGAKWVETSRVVL